MPFAGISLFQLIVVAEHYWLGCICFCPSTPVSFWVGAQENLVHHSVMDVGVEGITITSA